MILKVILGILLYLLIGVGVLEIVKWHDRNVDWVDAWIMFDEFEVLCVVFWIFPLMWIVFWLLYKGLYQFIRITRIFFTTIVYTVIALLKGE